MKTVHDIGLSSAEASALWSTYMSNSLAVCVLTYFFKHVKDIQVQPVLEYALNLSKDQVSKISMVFQEENYPMPQGFTDEDVNLDAPRLYSDSFYLYYLKEMGRFGMISYATSLTNATRPDMIEFFTQLLVSATELHNRATSVLLSQGVYVKPPYIPYPDETECVKKQSFLTGWFGDRRPVSIVEITHLYANILRNAHGKALLLGFAQTATTKEVSQWMMRGKAIADKNIEVFSSLLIEDDVPAPMTWDTEVTNSIVAPFSDKLMMFHVQATNGIGMSDYGAAIGQGLRRDVATHFTRLAAETLHYAEDGFNMMINHGWMEQTPLMADRDELAKIDKY